MGQLITIDWATALEVMKPLGSAVLGATVTQFVRRKPKLVTYYGHVSAFSLKGTTPPTPIHTHSVVVANSGSLPAKNVRLSHNVLPTDFEIHPSINYVVEMYPNGSGGDIVFPTLVPKQQITVSYLYGPPLVYSQVNSTVRSDEGFAKVLNVLPTPQLSPWLMRILYVLIFVGVTASLYMATELVGWASQALRVGGGAG